MTTYQGSKRYPKFFQGENIVWTKTFYSDFSKVTPVDPGSVTLHLKSPSGAEYTPTVSDDAGVGNFSASKVMDEWGVWAWRWETSNPTIVDQGFVDIIPSNIE